MILIMIMNNFNRQTSSGKVFAIFLKISGANLLIRSEYSPISQRIEARAVEIVTLSIIRTICLIMSPCCVVYWEEENNPINY